MDNLYIEAYKFYKNDYAHGLVLFHIQSHFEAYEDDAIQLGAVLNLPVYLQEGVKFCSFPDRISRGKWGIRNTKSETNFG